MYVSDELLEFFDFVLIGILISFIFDFFRACRKVRKVSFIAVAIQDIIYFVIVTIIFILSIMYILKTSIRLYIFLATILGLCIYFSILSKHIIKIYIKLFKMLKEMIKFIILPEELFIQNIIKIYFFFKKSIKICCKKFFCMILIIYKFLRRPFINKKTKEV